MSRKTSAARAKSSRIVTQVPWVKEHGELFRIASALGAPPRQVKVSIHSAGYTFEARFANENGQTVVGVTRVRRNRKGGLQIVEERTSIRFGFRLAGNVEAAA